MNSSLDSSGTSNFSNSGGVVLLEVLSPNSETVIGRERSHDAAEGDRRLSRLLGTIDEGGGEWGCDGVAFSPLALMMVVGSTDTPKLEK